MIISKKEAEEIIDQVATNKLGLTRAEALTGNDPAYWRARLLYGFLGLSDMPHIKAIIAHLESPDIAGGIMAAAPTTARAAAAIPALEIEVERPVKEEAPAKP